MLYFNDVMEYKKSILFNSGETCILSFETNSLSLQTEHPIVRNRVYTVNLCEIKNC